MIVVKRLTKCLLSILGYGNISTTIASERFHNRAQEDLWQK